MQTSNLRYLVLIGVLVLGAGLSVVAGEPVGPGTSRWPTDDGLYTVGGWSVAPEVVEENTNNAGVVTRLVSRVFSKPDGRAATLTLLSNQAAKLYGSGAEVPFLGAGYTVAPAPDSVLVGAGDGVSALLAQRGSERWLVLYAYGERRGLLGNGPLPWTLAVVDGILARPNDYYKLYLLAQTDQSGDPSREREVTELAHTVFPRIAAWYAD